MLKSKSAWYFAAAMSGLCAVASAVYGMWLFVALNGVFVFWYCAAARSAPNE